jgi:hypothetical protein
MILGQRPFLQEKAAFVVEDENREGPVESASFMRRYLFACTCLVVKFINKYDFFLHAGIL